MFCSPYAFDVILQTETLFDLPNLEHFRSIENNPHDWLQTDILQIHHLQYLVFQNITLNTQTEEQIKIYSVFLRTFSRHTYQLVWGSKFQVACL